MERDVIPQFDLTESTWSEVRQLREHAPDNLISLIENGHLENISRVSDLEPGQVSALGGGEFSACYFIRNNEQPLVVKFRHLSVEAEAEALKKWHERDARVPEVKGHGVVPCTATDEKPTKYLLEEAIVDGKGEPAPVAFKYLIAHPEQTDAVGRLIGIELAKMHMARGGKKFGGFGDMWDSSHKDKSFATYVTRRLKHYTSFFLEMGFEEKDLQSLFARVAKMPFPEESVYVHGDIGLHNILVKSDSPLSIRVFDPNPLLADPYWDIAGQKIRFDTARIEFERYPSDKLFKEEFEKQAKYYKALTTSYKEAAGIDEFVPDRMMINQLLQVASYIYYQKGKEPNTAKKPVDPTTSAITSDSSKIISASHVLFKQLTTRLIT